MTDAEFSANIEAMVETLYRVSYAQLQSSHDREEAVQEALCRAWQKRAQLREPRYMQTWVIRILLNECHNIQRRNKRVQPAEIVLSAPPGDADRELHGALLALETPLRLPIVLHYMEGFSVEEIAFMLRLPQGTVKSRMRRGRQKLRELLTEEVLEPCMTKTV